MFLEKLKCIAEGKNILPEATEIKGTQAFFILLQLEYSHKPCSSKIVYELTGLN